MLNIPETCHDYFNCCDCGGENCGCRYCFSCRACEYCREGEGEHCARISDDKFYLLTEEVKNIKASTET